MPDTDPRPATTPGPASALARPIDRRRALAIIGSSVAAMAFLEACGSGTTASAGPTGWVPADVNPANLAAGQPAQVQFAGTVSGSPVSGSAWLVKEATGNLLAFDPRCTHAKCAYEWTDQARFACLCHEGFFGVDGAVISGPPPRALDRFAVRETNGKVELEVPADFSTPRPKA
jgi:nitrite reductase/ring-hydroxylating ferredoxin subunit